MQALSLWVAKLLRIFQQTVLAAEFRRIIDAGQPAAR